MRRGSRWGRARLHVDVPLPPQAVLGAIEFAIAESEGLVVFTERHAPWGCGTRFSFWRNSAGSWSARIDAAIDGRAFDPERVAQAFRLVKRCRGDNFYRPFPLPFLWSDAKWSKLRQ